MRQVRRNIEHWLAWSGEKNLHDEPQKSENKQFYPYIIYWWAFTLRSDKKDIGHSIQITAMLRSTAEMRDDSSVCKWHEAEIMLKMTLKRINDWQTKSEWVKNYLLAKSENDDTNDFVQSCSRRFEWWLKISHKKFGGVILWLCDSGISSLVVKSRPRTWCVSSLPSAVNGCGAVVRYRDNIFTGARLKSRWL